MASWRSRRRMETRLVQQSCNTSQSSRTSTSHRQVLAMLVLVTRMLASARELPASSWLIVALHADCTRRLLGGAAMPAARVFAGLRAERSAGEHYPGCVGVGDVQPRHGWPARPGEGAPGDALKVVGDTLEDGGLERPEQLDYCVLRRPLLDDPHVLALIPRQGRPQWPCRLDKPIDQLQQDLAETGAAVRIRHRQGRARQDRPGPLAVLGPPLPHPGLRPPRPPRHRDPGQDPRHPRAWPVQRTHRIGQHKDPIAHPHRVRLPLPPTPSSPSPCSVSAATGRPYPAGPRHGSVSRGVFPGPASFSGPAESLV
jgi:hypothetical protein